MSTWIFDLILGMASASGAVVVVHFGRRASRIFSRAWRARIASNRIVLAELRAVRHELGAVRTEVRDGFDRVYERFGLGEERQNRTEAEVAHIRRGLAGIGSKRDGS